MTSFTCDQSYNGDTLDIPLLPRKGFTQSVSQQSSMLSCLRMPNNTLLVVEFVDIFLYVLCLVLSPLRLHTVSKTNLHFRNTIYIINNLKKNNNVMINCLCVK